MQYPSNDQSQKVEIAISCRSLKDADIFSKSDPQVIFKIKNNQSGQWYEVGRTETIMNNLNPNFKRSFQVEYIFEEKQEAYFEVRDDDGKGSFDHLGECYTTISAIVGSRNNTLILDLIDKKTQKKINKSKIILIAEKINECNNFILTQWKGVKLMNTDGWFDKSDPFLRIKRVREDNTQVVVHETEVIMDNLNPVWKPFELSCAQLSNGDFLRPIKVECWDWQKNQKFQFIGEFQFNVDELNKGKREFELTNPKKKNPGKICLINYQFIEKPSFLQYIRGNTQLNLVLAVDFTASNGAVSTPQSLHYLNPYVMNAYQQAIQSVGEILLDYDFDKKVPCYGFGGVPRYPGMTFSNTQHCFPMSGNPDNSEAFGLGEIMNLYSYSLNHVSLSGPTLFNPIIQETIKISEICKQQGSQVYTIMLILTDGEIHDMKDTIDSLVSASNLPLSVIIIGIGNADFTNMQKLDGDNGSLINSKNQRSTRDIVQFVPFRNFKGNGAALCKEVLAEVPQQLVQYMTSEGIKPQPAQAINASAIHMGQSVMQGQNINQVFAQNMQNFLAPHIQEVQFQAQQPILAPIAPPPPPPQGQQLPPQNFQQPPIQVQQYPPQDFYQPPPNVQQDPNFQFQQQLPQQQLYPVLNAQQQQQHPLYPPQVPQTGMYQSMQFNNQNQQPNQNMMNSMQQQPKQF